MKNIEQILADAGVETTDDQKKEIVKAVGENYKTVADWEKQRTKAQTLEKDLGEAGEKLKGLENVNPEELKEEIDRLKGDLEQKDKEFQQQIADRDFDEMLKAAISSAKGKNAKAITALLDVDTLKASKNQKEDIAAALKTLSEEEDSKMLFGEDESQNIGSGNPIGTVNKGGSQEADANIRSIMGLPPVQK